MVKFISARALAVVIFLESLYEVSVSINVTQLLFHRFYCITPTDMDTHRSSLLVLDHVRSRTECTLSCLSSSCARILLPAEQDGQQDFFCRNTPDMVPFLFQRNCKNKDATVSVFTKMNCDVECHASMYVNYLDITFCLHRAEARLTFSKGVSYCNSLGGTLAEAEDPKGVRFIGTLIRNLPRTGTSPLNIVWVGADDFASVGNYVWHRGDPVTREFFNANEPGGPNERCLAADGALLIDVPCDFEADVVCALPCFGRLP